MTTRLSGSSGKGGPSHTPPHEGDRPGIGELLRRARTGRGLTLEQIANETRIPQSHLEALEHDNLAVVPAGFYRRAEIRAYARAVNLDQNLALTELDRAEAAPDTPRRQELIFSRKRVLIVVAVAVAAAVFGRARGDENRPRPAPLIHRSTAYRPFRRRRPTPWSRPPHASSWITSRRCRRRQTAPWPCRRNRQVEHRRLRTATLRRQRNGLKPQCPQIRSPNSS